MSTPDTLPGPTRLPRPWPLPTPRLIGAACALAGLAAAARLLGVPDGAVTAAGGVAAAGLLALALGDAAVGRWRLHRHPLQLQRQLPHALAIGQPWRLALTLSHEGPQAWQVQLFDHVPPQFRAPGLPLHLQLPARQALETGYELTPTQRGPATLAPAGLRVHSRLGLVQWQLRVGQADTLKVYPNFAALSRYAWLAGDRRLSEIGIKTWQARGQGTDFKQLADYEPGASVRHIDWNATMRHRRPVVREFQDDRDQRVIFLLDCGRRMRADERVEGADGSHFDQALNALMLLAWVALKEGDAVGAMSFGHADGSHRLHAPAKGLVALNSLVARLHDIEPSLAHADYLVAARELLRREPRRALVVLLTNFREESGDELEAALKLLRGRHLVMVASLQERVVAELQAGPLDAPDQVRDMAAAHLFEQARRDAFNRLPGRHALRVDVEPQKLAAALVNRYHAVKAARWL